MTQTIDSRPGSGISRILAEQRRRAVIDPAYRLDIDLPSESSAPIAGRVVIEFELAPGAAWPPIDFAPASTDRESLEHLRHVSVNGKRFSFVVAHGHLLIDAPATPGPQRVEIHFRAGTSALTRRDDLVYTLFVPARAHTAFPCFDQPDLKATLTLTLTVPEQWAAVANAPEAERSRDGGRLHIRFMPTEPLPTYLFAWAAGELRCEERTVGGHHLRLLHTEQDATLLTHNRDDVFALHARALDILEAYTGIPYPFSQCAFVLIPDFQFGGMEHPGAIFYRRGLILLEDDAGESERLRRATLIAHETSHCWFGDLVTMPWFDDVWLKEVFANFMADKVVAQAFPAIDHALEFLLKHYPAAYSIDRTAGTHAIRQPLDNLDAAGELYDALIYHKAPIALADLEHELGATVLQSGVRAYLREFSFGNADWPTLVTCLQRETERDVGSWSRIWIESAGPPPTGPIDWDSPRYGRIELDETDRLAALDLLEHGAVDADTDTRAAVRRAGAWIALYEDMLAGGMDPTRLLAAALQSLDRDSEPLLLARIGHDAAEIYWRHLTGVQRGAAASAIERVLWRRARQARTNERLLFWLSVLTGVAQTPETIAELDAIAVAGAFRQAPLPESLGGQLALTLAVHRPARADSLIANQIEHTADRDRRARLSFLAAAVAPERAARDVFFARLLRGDGRELWAVAGLRWLNHPLRADQALHYLEPGLEHAGVLRAQGHIFLPRQWLDALFHGHGSRAAADLINDFVAGAEPALPARLRQLILQTADPVLRAAAHS